MAYKSFNQRFPAFKWVLLFAILLSIPLTVWSLNNVSTQYQQNATILTCGSSYGTCYKYSCPSGYTSISGTCGLMADSACCLAPLSGSPIGLVAYSSYCKTSTKEYDTINFNWLQYLKSTGATGYTLYHRIYTTNNSYSYIPIVINGLSNSQYLYTTSSLNGRRIQWYVVAQNQYYTSPKSSILTTPAATASCPL